MWETRRRVFQAAVGAFLASTAAAPATASVIGRTRSLALPLARLIDIGGSEIRYERVAGGFEAYATALNAGEGCVNSVSGVTTIRNTAPPNLTLDFSWRLPAEQLIRAGERFDYHLGFLSDEQARSVSDSTASTKFSGVSVPCP